MYQDVIRNRLLIKNQAIALAELQRAASTYAMCAFWRQKNDPEAENTTIGITVYTTEQKSHETLTTIRTNQQYYLCAALVEKLRLTVQ